MLKQNNQNTKKMANLILISISKAIPPKTSWNLYLVGIGLAIPNSIFFYSFYIHLYGSLTYNDTQTYTYKPMGYKEQKSLMGQKVECELRANNEKKDTKLDDGIKIGNLRRTRNNKIQIKENEIKKEIS